jgi:hypothetical protein
MFIVRDRVSTEHKGHEMFAGSSKSTSVALSHVELLVAGANLVAAL